MVGDVEGLAVLNHQSGSWRSFALEALATKFCFGLRRSTASGEQPLLLYYSGIPSFKLISNLNYTITMQNSKGTKVKAYTAHALVN